MAYVITSQDVELVQNRIKDIRCKSLYKSKIDMIA